MSPCASQFLAGFQAGTPRGGLLVAATRRPGQKLRCARNLTARRLALNLELERKEGWAGTALARRGPHGVRALPHKAEVLDQ
jgi:hypothetical protein